MATPLFCLGQRLRGRASTYRITQQVSEFVYFAADQRDRPVVVKSVEGHWRLHNERDILKRFQCRAPNLRLLLDEIQEPVEPPAIVLKHLHDDLTRASKKQRLTRQEIKFVAQNVLQSLQVLHEDGYVHTDIKPSNILVNYGRDSRFSEVQLADCGGVVSVDSEFAKDGVLTGTSLFRAPEVHLEMPWGTTADIWSFGLINLIWGFNFHLFEPDVPEGHKLYDVKILVLHHQWFGPFPISYKEIADQEAQENIVRIMSVIPPEKLKPFRYLREREISDADKRFVLKIMQLDPRDRPTATELLQDEWFTEQSERTVGWYSKQEWEQMKHR
ncbi:kinase-like protein [Aspergillus sclerotiicarbonarius CBS 121057]|uniref:Kinase-like protein n=1 Tax=Aspergillus sclerotiicarbonarius (strain CBS 121057 / IBT 28362) TaxID=1448318 RepID=A0A319F1Z1_ASPSB|nr:kinase-like protein [Aspergillus sclerotiicarbonarius CBS 121057]